MECVEISVVCQDLILPASPDSQGFVARLCKVDVNYKYGRINPEK